MKKLSAGILILVLTSLASSLSAQADVKAYLDSTRIEIGDHLTLHILLSCLPGIEISDPDLSAFSDAENLEVLSEEVWDTVDIGNRITLQKDLTITAWDSGYYQIPAIPVAYKYQGRSDTLYTKAIPLEVATIETDSSSLMPIKPIIEEPVKLADYWPVFAIIGGLLVLALLIFWLIRRKKPEEEIALPEIKLPPHEIALEKLQDLADQQLWQRGEIKEYHYQLTYIVREYLENRYSIPALESTTTQLLQRLQKTDFPTDWQLRLQPMLQTADLVKFAKAQPEREFHQKAMNDALELITTTQYIPTEEEEEE